MRDGAHFGGIECVLRLCLVGNHNSHGRALRLSEQHFRKMAGVGGGVSTSATPMKRSGMEMPPLCLPRAGITSASSGNSGVQRNFLTCVCLGQICRGVLETGCPNYHRRVQLIAATHSANFSAGV